MAAYFVALFHSPNDGKESRRVRDRSGREGSSSESQDFIADQVEPDIAWPLRRIEIVRLHGLLGVGSEFIPSFALGEDALGQTLGAIPAVRFLRHFEHDF